MKVTENYNLIKPEGGDFYDVEQFNQNMDTLDTKVKEIEDTQKKHINNSENPHGVTAEQIGLGKVANVATNDQTPTYTTASALSTLSSGERLSTAFGKIARAVSTLINHISTAAALSVSGHVKITDSDAVTDSTGLALAATEKNASISGTLANLIYSVNTVLNNAINSLAARVAALETVSNGVIAVYDTTVAIDSYTIRRQGKVVTFDALITYSGSSLNNKILLYISEDIIPAASVHLIGANGETGMAYRFVIKAGSNLIRGVSIKTNSTYTAGQQVCITGSWNVG